MIGLEFRKRQGFADEAADTLAQGVVPAFLMSGLTRILVDGVISALWQNGLIGLEEIGIGATAPIFRRNSVPQTLAGVGAAVTQDKSHNLSGTATQGGPQLGLVIAPVDKSPTLIP